MAEPRFLDCITLPSRGEGRLGASKRSAAVSTLNYFMKAESEFKTGWWMESKRLVIAKIALVAFLVAGVRFAAVAQSFDNIDFESATLV